MGDLEVKYLRCEYKVNPLGIDTPEPRLSWITEPVNKDTKAEVQTAYQILAASSEEKLDSDNGDLWDTGILPGDSSNHIAYSGKKLKTADMCFWKVRVWNSAGKISNWSNTAKWCMGVMEKVHWQAKWIGYDEYEHAEVNRDEYTFTPGTDKWIWAPSVAVEKSGFYNAFFRFTFEIKNAGNINSAFLLVTADERYTFYVNEIQAVESDKYIFSWARPQLIDIKAFLRTGINLFSAEGINTYLEKPGFTAKLFIDYYNGSKEIIKSNDQWKSSGTKIAGWNSLSFNDVEWNNAIVTAIMGDKPWRTPMHKLFLPPPPYLRKSFVLRKKVKKALAFISALGLFKLFLNGRLVSEDMFTPGWTDYRKRVYYLTYDVKDLLKTNDNAAGIILADGWYSGYIAWERRREYYGDEPRVLFQLHIEYDDGTTEQIVSDETWKAAYGPILETDILMGESYDAAKEKSFMNWCNAIFDDSEWKNAETSKADSIQLNSYPGNPVKKIFEIIPVGITSPRTNIFIFDLGRNIAGFVRLKVNGRKTNKIVLRFGEVIDEQGNLYTENIRMARSTDTYYTKGESDEIWEPCFTYHGFRYVEVSGYPENPDISMITGLVLHSDLPESGSFKCSDDKINKLYENIFTSQRANYFDIPTDCPQRDERLGWTADAIDFFNTASYNMETAAFFTKWLQDLNDAQDENGAYTAIAPQPDICVGPLYSGAAAWADAGIITPYLHYLFYRDTQILTKYFNNMERYMQYLSDNSRGFLRGDYGYGDWLSINAVTNKDLIATGFFAYDAKIMAQIANILNRKKEEKKYRDLFNNIKNAFRNKYITSDGLLVNCTQTAYLLVLSFELLENEKEINKALAWLYNDIEERDSHVSSGFVGLTYLLPLLTRSGRSDIAYKLLMNESYPSWLHMLNNGATSMWERWDSYSKEKGIYDPLMNSFNHTSLGVIGEWFYSAIGGIKMAEPAFKRIVIQPNPGGGLTMADVSYNSLYGMIRSHWEIDNNIFKLDINIPVNTSAVVVLSKNYFRLNNESLGLSDKNGNYIAEVGSGRHTFILEHSFPGLSRSKP